ncbi:MAG: penicillin-binding protein 2 [Gammaproteobacteria bacterium]|nr:penicillin-binding protein 2 [Gammaproteobacteria bacterium]
MLHRTLIKDHLQEQNVFRRRALVAAVVCLLLIFVLFIRLFNLQVLEHKHFNKLSENNRVRLMAIAPNRGLIYDRNGVILAENRPSYRLEVTPEQVEDMDWLLTELGQLVELDESTLKRFRKAIKRSRPFEAIPLRTALSDDEVARLAVNRHKYAGMDISARLSRFYPQGKSAVHVMGYVGRIDEDELKIVDQTQYAGTSHIGKTGLERFYEDELHGKVGHQSVEVNVQGRILRVLEKKQPVPGNNLILSLDTRLQSVAEKSLEDYNGAAVVMNPNNGEILALVSMPIYDPNLFVHGIALKDYQRLQNPDTRPMYNRALYGQYPPGSTIKQFVGLAGLESKVIGHKMTIPCEGFYMLPNEERRYRDWKKTGHGHVDLQDALAESCDVYYYELANRLGIDRIHDFMQKFGFGKPTGVDIQGEKGGLLPSREWKMRTRNKIWFPGETLIAGIGQGYVLATPMQLASATSILAMRGKGYRPRLLNEIFDPATGESRVKEPVPLPEIKLNRPQNWDHVIKGMVNVVHSIRGTARSSGIGLKFKMAGKTGTAQVFGVAQDAEYDEDTIAKKLRDHALFVAFAPADKPEIAIAVIAENGGSGSSVAAPIVRKILDTWLQTKE